MTNDEWVKRYVTPTLRTSGVWRVAAAGRARHFGQGKRWVDDYKNRKLAALTSFPSALPNRPSIKAADSSPPAVCRAEADYW
jgi:hypothetical protein